MCKICSWAILAECLTFSAAPGSSSRVVATENWRERERLDDEWKVWSFGNLPTKRACAFGV